MCSKARKALLVVPLSVACSAAGYDAKLSDSGGAGADVGTADTGEAQAFAAPVWWKLDASLQVSAGQLSAAGSELVVQLLDVNAAEVCTEVFRLSSTDTQPTQPDPSILTWWLIGVGEGTGACDGVMEAGALPDELYLGVGAMHPELIAVAGQMEGLPEDGIDGLNGAYAKVDPDVGDTWVYGFAGNAEAWSGRGGPATVAPLADGTWDLKAAYAFPLR